MNHKKPKTKLIIYLQKKQFAVFFKTGVAGFQLYKKEKYFTVYITKVFKDTFFTEYQPQTTACIFSITK